MQPFDCVLEGQTAATWSAGFGETFKKEEGNKKKSYPSRGIIFVFTERPGKMGENSGGKEFKEDENLPLQRLLKLFLNQAAVSDRAM